MAHLRSTLAALALGAAIIATPARAQNGSSVSLTHTVTVTVPPRVRVQLAQPTRLVQSATRISSPRTPTDGIALTISATQAWMLSIGSVIGASRSRWSLASNSGFAAVTSGSATVVTGVLSATPTSAIVFFRNAASADSDSATGSDSVVLTMAAQ